MTKFDKVSGKKDEPIQMVLLSECYRRGMRRYLAVYAEDEKKLQSVFH